MITAFVFSTLFLVSYILHHALHGDVRYPVHAALRSLYLPLLASHIVLAVIALPLVLVTFFFSLTGRIPQHRKVARWTFPLWLYVSVTGVDHLRDAAPRAGNVSRMPVSERTPVSAKRIASPNDGTRQLLQWGSSMMGAGVLAAILLQTLLGGFSPTGASTNTGWFALIVALMCIPFGGLLLTLGVAKWLRNRSNQQSGTRQG